MEKEKLELNENDNKLLAYCYDRPRSISQIAKYLNISPKNVSVRIPKLQDKKLIDIESKGHGKKTLIRTIEGIKVHKYILEILKQIKMRGGKISMREYAALPEMSSMIIDDPDYYDKTMAHFAVLYSSNPALIEQQIVLTKEGEQFLKKCKDKK